MKTPKSYRLSPTAITLLEMLKDDPRYATCTETEIVELAIMYLHTNAGEKDKEVEP